MNQPIVHISGRRLVDRNDFHGEFADAFGFPDFYGQNINAWHDCMFSLEEPAHGMSKVHAAPGGTVVICLDDYARLRARRADLVSRIHHAAAFVNWAKLEEGEQAVLAVAASVDDAPRPSGNRPEHQKLTNAPNETASYDADRMVLPQPRAELRGDQLAISKEPLADFATALGLATSPPVTPEHLRLELRKAAVAGRFPDQPDAPESATLILALEKFEPLKQRRSSIVTQLLELTSIVNMDLIKSGCPATFVWSFYD